MMRFSVLNYFERLRDTREVARVRHNSDFGLQTPVCVTMTTLAVDHADFGHRHRYSYHFAGAAEIFPYLLDMPRPRNPHRIADAAEILQPDIIQGEQWSLFKLLPLLQSKLRCIQWLAQRRLLRNSMECGVCRNPAALIKYQQGLDGYRWKCNDCQWSASVRQDSYFSKSHLLLHKIVEMIYFWSNNNPQSMAVQETGLRKNTVVDWFNFFRDDCCIWVDNSLQPIGGLDENLEDSIVEIDESCFFRRKHHVGRVGPHQWVFGAVQRGTHKCFMVPVANRSRATLQPIIEQHILPGTRVISDGWASYEQLDTFGGGGVFTHDVVIHQRNFVDPDDDAIHTQSIESLWKRAKKSCGIKAAPARSSSHLTLRGLCGGKITAKL